MGCAQTKSKQISMPKEQAEQFNDPKPPTLPSILKKYKSTNHEVAFSTIPIPDNSVSVAQE